MQFPMLLVGFEWLREVEEDVHIYEDKSVCTRGQKSQDQDKFSQNSVEWISVEDC